LPQLSNLDSYIRIVKDKALLRQTMIACQTIFDQCAVAQEPSEEILDAATAILERVREKQGLGKSTWTTPYEVVQRGGPALLIPERGAAIGLKTPWSRLTRMTSGWNPGDLVIIAGRPGAGKSVVAMQQAHTTALEGGGVAYVSLEMGKESLTRRLVTGISRVDAHEARSGFLNSEEKRRMLEAANDLELLPLFIDDTRTHTPAAVGAALRRLRARTNVRLVIIDHLQLMGLSGRAESRHHELSEICHGFKRLAGQMECVVMLLSQLNRSSDKEKRRPNLSNSDLKETGSIEEDADVVGLLHRPEMLNRSDQSLRGQAELIIAKQRSGPTGLIKLRFLDRFQVFEPAADREDEAE
jgi:replicative DNA helicase